MPVTSKRETEMLIQEIRAAFNRLKSVAESLHSDLNITPSMRAVLEALVLQAPQTVPEIARSKGVSRQHVQKNMNALLKAGFVDTQDNPDHKRSGLYRPSPAGNALFADIQTREEKPLAALIEALAGHDVPAAVRLLAHFNETLETLTKTGD